MSRGKASERRQSRLSLTRVIPLVEHRTNSLTVPATVKHNGVTVETQQLRYRRAQETLQWDAAGNLTNDAMLAFTYDVGVDHSSTQQTVAGGDGRGNVTVLLDALATDTTTPMNNLKAGVEYAPYGEMVRSVGDLGQMPFRFQSNWAMGQGWAGSWPLELVDFGRRMYAPGLGRFISRDPAGESARANLYHYCGNDPINRIDPLGLMPLRVPVVVPVDPWWEHGSFSDHPSLRGFYSEVRPWGSERDRYYRVIGFIDSSGGGGSSGGGASSGSRREGEYGSLTAGQENIVEAAIWWIAAVGNAWLASGLEPV